MLTSALLYAAAPAQAATCTLVGGFEIDGNMTANTCGGADWANQPGVQSTSTIGTYNVVKDKSNPANWSNGGGTPPKVNFTNVYAFTQVVGTDYFAYVGWERSQNSGTGGYAIEIDNAGVRVGSDGAPQPDRHLGGFVFYITTMGSDAPVLGQSCAFTSQATYPGTCSNATNGYNAAINDAQIHDPLADIDVPTGEFLEVGLNVTELTGIAPSCPAPSAASLYMRSFTGQNSGPTGNLKGFVAPLAVAPASTCVTPGLDTTATPGGSSVEPGTSQHDFAQLTPVPGRPPVTGTVDFFLCGPTNSAQDCSTGGTPVGGAVQVQNNVAISDSVSGATDTAVGFYCWRAEYTPDADGAKNYLPTQHTNAGTECFQVIKALTGISTDATSGKIGDAIHDVATLSGAFPDAGGHITFNLYGPSATPDCTTTPVFTVDVDVNGPGQYNSGDFIPLTAGNYYWTAAYSGDTGNQPSSGACGASNETSPIGLQANGLTTTATSATLGSAVSDTGHLTGTTANAGGTITFNLYGPSATADCTGTAVYTNTVPVTGPGDYNSGDFVPTTAGSYYWTASYSGDVNNQPSSDACGADGETSTVAALVTGITTEATSGTVGDAIHDVATLTGAGAGAGGLITFNLYGPSDTPDCSGPPVFTDTVQVNGPGTYTSGEFKPGGSGSYYWIAAYTGDVNDQPSAGTCGDKGETSGLQAEALAATGTPLLSDQINWALTLLVLGGFLMTAGVRRPKRYARKH